MWNFTSLHEQRQEEQQQQQLHQQKGKTTRYSHDEEQESFGDGGMATTSAASASASATATVVAWNFLRENMMNFKMMNNKVGVAEAAVADGRSDTPPQFTTPTRIQEGRPATIPAASSSFALLDDSNQLPDRLLDFFCVIGVDADDAVAATTAATATDGSGDGSSASSSSISSKVMETPKVLDCYPDPNFYKGVEFPHQIAKFLFPKGLKQEEEKESSSSPPQATKTTTTLMTFVLTQSNGRRFYGTSLKFYEKKKKQQSNNNNQHQHHYVVPKCLVLLSHYAFYDTMTIFLKQLYRVFKSTTSAVLPIERYIANMIHDIPLPPQGLQLIEFKEGFFTTDACLTIQRPPPNQLPMMNLSYKPMFRCLSITNILTIWGILLQEGRVVLCSKYHRLLTPVAETLTSLLYPLSWQGMYMPAILPKDMVLDYSLLHAPIPFLVGIDSDYLILLKKDPYQYHPKGVVFVDLDEDIIHLGWEEEEDHHQHQDFVPRKQPDLPYGAVSTLKVQLEELGADQYYLVPSCGIKGRITTGDGTQFLDNANRETYGQVTKVEPLHPASANDNDDNEDHRHFILSNAERAFVVDDDEKTVYQNLKVEDFVVTINDNNDYNGIIHRTGTTTTSTTTEDWLTSQRSVSSHSTAGGPLVVAATSTIHNNTNNKPFPSLLQDYVKERIKVQGRTVQAHVDRFMSMIGQREYATPAYYHHNHHNNNSVHGAAAPASATELNKDDVRKRRLEIAATFYDIEDSNNNNNTATTTRTKQTNKTDNNKKNDNNNNFDFNIRWAFVEFFTTIFLRYRLFLVNHNNKNQNTNNNGTPSSSSSTTTTTTTSTTTFQKSLFLKDLNLSRGNEAFMALVLQTQMFDKFLEERSNTNKNKAHLPQVILFDEFIIAKLYRQSSLLLNPQSATSTTTGSNKKFSSTPFIKEKRWRIRKVITPPAPCADGIIKLGEEFDCYHNNYGESFPKLNKTEFVANSMKTKQQQNQQQSTQDSFFGAAGSFCFFYDSFKSLLCGT